MSAGINGAEITLRTPAARSAPAVMAADDGLLVGAGTLLEPQQAAQAAQAADACARFAVSPGFDPELLDACQAQSLPLLLGVATATEIQRVLRAGVRTCKFFPAESCGGLGALAALAGPFPGDALRAHRRHRPVERRWLPPFSVGARRRRHVAGPARPDVGGPLGSHPAACRQGCPDRPYPLDRAPAEGRGISGGTRS